MEMTQNEQKELVAATAIDTLIKDKKIFSGMKIGLGTGSTAIPAVKHLAKRISDGTIKDIKAVATSFGTQNLCEELGIPVYSMNDKVIGGHLDLAIDGADEVDLDNNVIKGGGAALLREKIVAYNSTQFVIVADKTKMVDTLGTKFRLPVEIIAEARVPVEVALKEVGADCILREGVKKCGPVITDNGNQILDILWQEAVNPCILEDRINSIVGVVENGFFTKNKPIVFTIGEDFNVIQR